MIVIGGIGTLSGAIFGTVFFKLLEEGVMWATPLISGLFGGVGHLDTVLSLVLFGAVIAAFLIFEPRGLDHLWNRFKNYYRLWPFPY